MAAGQNRCGWVNLAGDTGVRDVRALRRIVMELMQIYLKENGAVRTKDLDRRPQGLCCGWFSVSDDLRLFG